MVLNNATDIFYVQGAGCLVEAEIGRGLIVSPVLAAVQVWETGAEAANGFDET